MPAKARSGIKKRALPAVEIDGQYLSIRYGKLLHLRLARRNLVGFQSWMEGRRWRYKIEYNFSDTEPILTEYHSQKDWEVILEKIETLVPKPTLKQ
jgi:hypothetical protein